MTNHKSILILTKHNLCVSFQPPGDNTSYLLEVSASSFKLSKARGFNVICGP